MLHIQLAALALVGVALVASGCGGSSKTAESTTTAATASTAAATSTTAVATQPTTTVQLATGRPLTRAQWIAKAEAICTRTNSNISATTAQTPKEFGRAFPQIAIYEHIESQELSKLVPPASKTRDWAQIVNNLQIVSEESNVIATDFQAQNYKAGVPVLKAAEDLHQELNETAKHDGFNECSHTRVRRVAHG
jgi:hypothetical protein